MNYIIGGGFVGLLARDILGPGYSIIPIGKSRFYSHKPPVADDFIIRDEAIDDYMNQFAFMPVYHKIGYSIAGQITYNHDLALDAWLHKKFGDDIPSHADQYMRSHTEFFVYGDCSEIYTRLKNRYKEEMISNHQKYGVVTSISNHVIKTETGASIEYDNVVSTVPLNVITGWLGKETKLPVSDVWCYHLKTDKLDFEGANGLLVCDPEIEGIYYANKISNDNYILYSNKKIEYPGQLFHSLVGDFVLIGEINIPEAMPRGDKPKPASFSDGYLMAMLEDNGVTPVGSCAEWDDCLDIGSVIKKLIRMK